MGLKQFNSQLSAERGEGRRGGKGREGNEAAAKGKELRHLH